jgi:hypothetical protein
MGGLAGAAGRAGTTGADAAGAGLAGGFGMYSGPGWPQPDSAPDKATAAAI